uniref:Ionotropic glutamate receptor C-terminal domain-containing protein n=1 Tax=Panagrolaimus sp. ES5 TaxID=591445 RepID=A0AC34FIL6_9BILA
MTNPFTFQYTGMMIRSPDRYSDNTWLIVTEPFTWEIWVLILISIIVSGIWLKLSNIIISKVYCEVEYNYFTSTWVFFSVFVQQGLHRQPTSWSSRIVVALWWLSSVTLLASFTGSLVALFAVERDTLPMHTINDVVKSLNTGRYKILMVTSSKWQLEIIAVNY